MGVGPRELIEPRRLLGPFRALALVAVLCARAISAETDGAASSPRTEILLNGIWESRRDADAGSWIRMRVPEPLVVRKEESPVAYRLRFTLPAAERHGRRVMLVFEKAGHHVRVTLNGTVVGEHYGVRLPFSFDITDALREGIENELSVWAAPADPADARLGGVATADEAKAYDIFLPGSPMGWYPGGIFGDVALQLVPTVRVEDSFVRTSFRQKTIAIMLQVANHGRAAATVTARTEVVSLEGAPTRVEFPDETLTLPPEGHASIERTVAFPDAVPWPDGGRDTPPLYVLRTSLTNGARMEDLVTKRFAFREVWSEGRNLILNGKALHVAADVVTATSSTGRQRLAHLFDALHSVGLNLVHPHWDDASGTFYDLADEAGMLVMPGLYCSGPPQLTRSVVAPAPWVDDMTAQYEAWVPLRRDHPSIALWSPYDIPPRAVSKSDLERFDRSVRAADPTRPILGGDILRTSIGDAHQFIVDPSDPLRIAYERQLARSREEGRPLLVPEIATFANATPEDVTALLERFRSDGVTGYGGYLLDTVLFHSRGLKVSWPSASGHDARPPAPLGMVSDVVNWSDPSRPEVMRTKLGRLARRVHPTALGTTSAPLRFVRSPELLVIAPAACGGRGYVLATPLSGAGGIERGTLLDPDGKGWLLLTEPGTYRIRVACDGDRETTVEAKGRPFTAVPGFGYLQEVRLDRP